MITRRKFVTGLGVATIAQATRSAWASPAAQTLDESVPTPQSLETPYKYGKLILAASTDPTAFDSKSVDCPFVFRHGDRFLMAYIAFDGTGYQTGLASSKDLVNWERQGCILRRDPQSDVTLSLIHI